MKGLSVTFLSINKRFNFSIWKLQIISFSQFFRNGSSVIINTVGGQLLGNEQACPLGSSSSSELFSEEQICFAIDFWSLELWFQDDKMYSNSWWGNPPNFSRNCFNVLQADDEDVCVDTHSKAWAFCFDQMGQCKLPAPGTTLCSSYSLCLGYSVSL